LPHIFLKLDSAAAEAACVRSKFMGVLYSTFYEEVDADIYLSLRQDAILSATEFDFTAYQRWNPPKEGVAQDDTGSTQEDRDG
jgi:hypothetical protein